MPDYAQPLNDWLAQAPPQPPPKVMGKSLAELLGPYLGITKPKDEAGPQPMTMAQPPVVGNRPDVQEIVKAAGASAAEPFGQLGRVMTGSSEHWPTDLAGAAIGLAPIGPPGAGKALKAGAEAAEVALAKGATGGLGDMIKAYHGSPHDFDRFDLSKIGTGEGAQAYGHGLYFAENEGIAKHYREGLAGVPSAKFAGDADYPFAAASKAVREMQEKNPLPSYLSSARKDIQNSITRHMTLDAPADEKALAAYVDDIASTYPSDAQPQIRQWANEAADTIRPHLEVHRPGKMYQVGIRADPAHFLDWDKPLSELPKHQLDAINALPGVKKYLSETDTGKWLPNATVEKAMQKARYSGYGDSFNANALREAGIPGIKYLDQGSRLPKSDFTVWAPRLGRNEQFEVRGPGGEVRGKYDSREQASAFADQENARLNPQTRNFVVFDDKLIDILKKYGLAGVGALPAMNAFHYQDKGS